MSVKITDMTPDASISGVELIPVSDAGAAKSVTISGIKNFVVDQIEAIAAGTTVATGQGIFMLQSGVMKPVDIDVVAQRAIDTIWGKAANATPAVGDSMVSKTVGGVEKTVTITVLAELVRATIEAAILDVSSLGAAAALTGADMLLVTQGTTGKRVTLTLVSDAIYAALNAYVVALGAVSSPADSDVFYVIQGGNEKKVTLATLKTAFGTTIAPAATTENNVPQWASGQKTLVDGLTVQTTVRADGTAVDTALATEKAIRTMFLGGTFPAGGATGTVAQRFGATAAEGLETVVVDKTVTLGAVAGVAVFTIPSGAVLKSVQGNVEVLAVAGGTTVLVGLGIDADPNLYGQTTALTKDSKIDTLLTYAALSGSVALEAYPLAAGGGIGDTQFSAGSLRVRIVYDRLTSLANAA